MNVTVECSRCHEKIDGIIDNGVTGGFYDVNEGSGWELFANVGEEIVCDTCMHQDYRYRSVYCGEGVIDMKSVMSMIEEDYSITFCKHQNHYEVEIHDGNKYDRHSEFVANGIGRTLELAINNAHLQYLRWYDKRISGL